MLKYQVEMSCHHYYKMFTDNSRGFLFLSVALGTMSKHLVLVYINNSIQSDVKINYKIIYILKFLQHSHYSLGLYVICVTAYVSQ